MPRRKDRRDRFQNSSIGKEYGILMAGKIILKMSYRKDQVQNAQLQRLSKHFQNAHGKDSGDYLQNPSAQLEKLFKNFSSAVWETSFLKS